MFPTPHKHTLVPHPTNILWVHTPETHPGPTSHNPPPPWSHTPQTHPGVSNHFKYSFSWNYVVPLWKEIFTERDRKAYDRTFLTPKRIA